MAFGLEIVLIVAISLLALAKSQRWAPWLLLSGLVIVGALSMLNRLGVSWNVPTPYLFLLNPYLLVAVAFALITGGGVGVAVRGLRKWPGWFRA